MSTIDSAGRIVVGTDGSDRAAHAISWAAERAHVRHLPLLVVHVIPEIIVPTRTAAAAQISLGSNYYEQVRSKAVQTVEKLADRARDAYSDIEVETEVVEGHPIEVLSEISKNADLLVIGARGRSAPTALRILGGTADAVCAHAPGAVVVVPESFDKDNGGCVVVGVDDSVQSRLAIARAFDAAWSRKVELVALTAWDYGPYDAYNADVWHYNAREISEAFTDHVEQLIAPMRERYPEVEVRIEVKRERPDEALIEASKDAGLIVMGSRGRGGFKGLLLGSTSKRVLREAKCPVLITRGEAGWTPDKPGES